MSLNVLGGSVVHYPADPVKFEFDSEVSRIFDNMAIRSIPMYEEVHRMHVSMLHDVLSQDEVVVYDVGASRGRFFKEICNQFQLSPRVGREGLKLHAVDTSTDMLRNLLSEMPFVQGHHAAAQSLPDLEEKADIVCMLYILQFIESPTEKLKALEWAKNNLKPGGYLILGQKHLVPPSVDSRLTAEYIKFRVRNGYSMDEIRAKTAALNHSMWPIRQEFLEDMCMQAGFVDYVETSRWLQFSTSLCINAR